MTTYLEKRSQPAAHPKPHPPAQSTLTAISKPWRQSSFGSIDRFLNPQQNSMMFLVSSRPWTATETHLAYVVCSFVFAEIRFFKIRGSKRVNRGSVFAWPAWPNDAEWIAVAYYGHLGSVRQAEEASNTTLGSAEPHHSNGQALELSAPVNVRIRRRFGAGG
jgi:hypothetical protein